VRGRETFSDMVKKGDSGRIWPLSTGDVAENSKTKRTRRTRKRVAWLCQALRSASEPIRGSLVYELMQSPASLPQRRIGGFKNFAPQRKPTFQQYSAKPSLRRSTSAGSSVGSQASIELLDCSVISIGLADQSSFGRLCARCRTLFRKQMSSQSQLDQVTGAKFAVDCEVEIARSRLDSAISSELGSTRHVSVREALWPTSNPLFQGS